MLAIAAQLSGEEKTGALHAIASQGCHLADRAVRAEIKAVVTDSLSAVTARYFVCVNGPQPESGCCSGPDQFG